MKFVLLAAGKSKRLYKKIKKNKCLLKLGDKSIIENTILAVRKTKIEDISIVVGFKSEKIKLHLKKYNKIEYILNKKYNSREMLYSLMLALKKYNNDIIFGYSDIIISKKVLKKIIDANKSNITIPILSNWKKIWKIRNKNPYEDAETLFIKKNMKLHSIGKQISSLKDVKYQFMGLIYIPKSKRNLVLRQYKKTNKKYNLHLTTFINELVKKKVNIDCIKLKDKWYEFDDYDDYKNYKKYYL